MTEFMFIAVAAPVIGGTLALIFWLLSINKESNRIYLAKRRAEETGSDYKHEYDPEHRKTIVDTMVTKELSGEVNWSKVYKSVLDREGITVLEIKGEIERRAGKKLSDG